MLIENIEIAKSIIAIWLRVDKAIIFFISCSQLAEKPAIIIVIVEIDIMINVDKG